VAGVALLAALHGGCSGGSGGPVATATPTELSAEAQEALAVFQRARGASQDLLSYSAALEGVYTIRGVTVDVAGSREVALPDRMHATTSTGGAHTEIVTRLGRLFVLEPGKGTYIDSGITTAADFYPLNQIIVSRVHDMQVKTERLPGYDEDVYVLTFTLRGRDVLQAAAHLFGSSRSLEAAIGEDEPEGDALCQLVIRTSDHRLARFDVNAEMMLSGQPFILDAGEQYSRFNEPVTIPDVSPAAPMPE
jgi:hypothetical protein